MPSFTPNVKGQFFFTIFNTVLDMLHSMPGDAVGLVREPDWAILCKNLRPDRTRDEVRALFYPEAGLSAPDVRDKRRAGFLLSFDAQSYWDIYDWVLQGPELRFPSVRRVVKLSRNEGQVLHKVMRHVVDWVHPEANSVVARRDNNKPPLYCDLVPALNGNQKKVRVNKRKQPDYSWRGLPGQSPEATAVLLQQEVCDFVLPRIASFRNPKSCLEQFLDTSNEATYITRFDQDDWAEVLSIVRRYAGPELRPAWTCRSSHRRAGSPALHATAISALAEGCCNFIRDDPIFADDASTRGKLDSAVFRTAMARWFSQHWRMPTVSDDLPRQATHGRVRQTASPELDDASVDGAAKPVASDAAVDLAAGRLAADAGDAFQSIPCAKSKTIAETLAPAESRRPPPDLIRPSPPGRAKALRPTQRPAHTSQRGEATKEDGETAPRRQLPAWRRVPQAS